MTEAKPVENYEIRISRSNFTHIHEYLCRVSFLTTLDIYKDYFKGRLEWCKGCCNCCYTHIVIGDKIALVHHILSRNYCVFVPRVLWSRSFLIFIVGWIEGLCSQHLPQVGVLVTYWDSCIERRDCCYITSSIGYWGKGSTVGY